ncbi:MAG: hypothetical protein P8R42_24165 [Candidatus Binatia bacterium]|nr:hypothetical protein [Candidatus Binatia bacterium]
MHYKPEDIPILTPDYGNGCMRSVKAGNMELGATWVKSAVDTTPYYKGLPDDACPCEHYGYVISGSFRIHYLDGSEEHVKAGELYYIPKGHHFIYDEACHHLEINPHEDLQRLMQHFNAQLSQQGDTTPQEPKP